MIRLGTVVVLLLGALGCASQADCPSDAGTDANVQDVGVDAGPPDAGPDGGPSCVSAPGTLEIALVPLVSPSSNTAYPTDADTRTVHLVVYRRGEASPLLTRDGGPDVLQVGPLVDGSYDVAIELDGYTVGAERMAPPHCVGADRRDAPGCAVVPFTIRGCQLTALVVALYCDPAGRDCPAEDWPWPH